MFRVGVRWTLDDAQWSRLAPETANRWRTGTLSGVTRARTIALAAALMATACGGGSVAGAVAGEDSLRTIQGDEVVLSSFAGPAVVFVWEPG